PVLGAATGFGLALGTVASPVSVDGSGVGQLPEAFLWRRSVVRKPPVVLAFPALAYRGTVQAILLRGHAHAGHTGCAAIRGALDADRGHALASAASRSVSGIAPAHGHLPVVQPGRSHADGQW